MYLIDVVFYTQVLCELCESNTSCINFVPHQIFIAPYIILHKTLEYNVIELIIIYNRPVLTNLQKLSRTCILSTLKLKHAQMKQHMTLAALMVLIKSLVAREVSLVFNTFNTIVTFKTQ